MRPEHDRLVRMSNQDLSEAMRKRRERMLHQSQLGPLIGYLVLALLVGAIFSIGSPDQAASEPLFAGQAAGPAASEGQELYNRYCFGCHGPVGEGNEAAGIPPLNQDGAAWQRSRSELVNHILDGGETMPELSGLVSERDAGLLIDFVQTWWTEEQIASFNDAGE